MDVSAYKGKAINQSLSIFFPFYNDAGTVEKTIKDAYIYGEKLTNDLEVVAINDGSKDHTSTELSRMKDIFPKLKIIHHQVNRGYGGAIISGINNSTKEWLFYTDGDAQYHLNELESLWNIRHNYDIVNGYKLSRADNFPRRILGVSYRRLINFVFTIPVRDIDCDYRLMKGEIVRSLDLKCTSGAITVELIKKLFLKTNKFTEVGVQHFPRVYGKSAFFTIKSVFNTLKDEFFLLKELKNLYRYID